MPHLPEEVKCVGGDKKTMNILQVHTCPNRRLLIPSAREKMEDSAVTSCVGLLAALREPVNAEELSDDVDGEVESNTVEAWAISEACTRVLQDASKGVTDNTYREYRR
jgi:hypothetical protein